ncbi:DUF1801 domain-containing protein [Sandaracinobacter neustonicus]|uniref:DUF1801 domain-containing protein n=1 Tax=Sandaracinobacter neustonicus TaxID=1715348 RepID=A0A501XEP7_9SPHN|nr:DUF1801 domain-containing protein [Sandaracinobacter neustonicus]TPE59042.1 DUF1801 domain-containing protein [Sandaracinobacter neustonicus]
MPEAKTKPTEISVETYLDSVAPPERRAEGRALDALFRRVTGWTPRMWGPSIIGYGRYSYRYDSGHSGVTCATGFSPRKAELVLYVLPQDEDLTEALARLGKHKVGKSCLYLKRLSDADEEVLGEIITAGLGALARRWPVEAS